ncbi:hypothetical protein BASA50_004242 [Batrachochytrium salamandrivorans]|uniref:Uncharacterized protein n=1 Tax=Batrachochytrium salamandrivorans TaxID=1357716 RepID=A0ABQ8FH32_9FUNG|nr:hypothetical protein BASA60_003368 [Batrachochytrium salamandrivorans]KAH6597635.1 hypothetical protein BASA50_004242 [Batrachochytrium salamandrivorans]KAH6602160.1 hypothetical protein BASA61_001406 [Batrachochytrium salamandrivorans]KAH9264137.1 hypothetical protein BASA83_012393 [Batrachochytrium salamandrivorans]KAJ1342564.1 hypothetical protein BSLG_002881 [Batrachochytrium salamandrivorans]
MFLYRVLSIAMLIASSVSAPTSDDYSGVEESSTSTVTTCTGDYCGCEMGYCWRVKPTNDSIVSYTPFRFCSSVSSCLQGCIDGTCHVMDEKHVVTVSTGQVCQVSADCFSYIKSVKDPVPASPPQ